MTMPLESAKRLAQRERQIEEQSEAAERAAWRLLVEFAAYAGTLFDRLDIFDEAHDALLPEAALSERWREVLVYPEVEMNRGWGVRVLLSDNGRVAAAWYPSLDREEPTGKEQAPRSAQVAQDAFVPSEQWALITMERDEQLPADLAERALVKLWKAVERIHDRVEACEQRLLERIKFLDAVERRLERGVTE